MTGPNIPTDLEEDEPWRLAAACRGLLGAVDFWPDEFRSTEVAPAKAVCAQCAVREECLERALRRPEHGVWGGLTASERAKVRRNRRRAERRSG